ncbi:hypothetical protein Hdeb2414_s0165g00820101 [Helianthus debilis subsp. tardiflorus]
MSGQTPRSALGDVTNQVGKRGFSLVFDLDVKSAKKECRRVDECKENNNNKEAAECVLRVHSGGEIGLSKGGIGESVNKIVCEVKEQCPPGVRQNVTVTSSVVKAVDVASDGCQYAGDIGLPKGDIVECVDKIVCEVEETCPPGVRQNAAVTSSVVKAADVVSGGCRDTELVHAIALDENGPDVIVDDEEDERTESADLALIESKGVAENDLGVDDGNDVSVDNLGSSKDDYIDCTRLLESQESKCGLERCVGQTGDGMSSACMDMIKECSCSFCMKAAQLWSDLHYEDIKGRIAAIKKSQKEATILVNRNSRDVASNCGKLSNLESDLTGRWKSLFLHMEDIFVREGTQLETSLSTLKEVIDDCKTDSEKN